MKYKNYESQMNKSIAEVKMYILLLIKGVDQPDIHMIINGSIDNKQLQKKLRKRPDISILLFTKIKEALDEADTFAVLEDHLVYMNTILDPYFPPVIRYKYNLFNYIVKNEDFDVQSYCILRHLLKFKYQYITAFITYMCELKKMSEKEYHHLASEIFCIEHLYDDAYEHLQNTTCNGTIQKYRLRLYQYSPYKFRRIIEPRPRGVLQMLLNR